MSSQVALPVRQRSVVLVTPDADLRQRLEEHLLNMRWHVLAAAGGAEAIVHLDGSAPEAMIVDHWLPDLDAAEFSSYAAALCPGTDFLGMDGSASLTGCRSARRHELLHALREAQEGGQMPALAPAPQGATSSSPRPAMPVSEGRLFASPRPPATDGAIRKHAPETIPRAIARVLPFEELATVQSVQVLPPHAPVMPRAVQMYLPEMVGDAEGMRELASMVRMAAPHTVTVLIQGETGTGKELVAKAVHRLSKRANKPFVVLNCAAIPEHLLEAELFGHTRGAFTGAVTSRTGRIEAAHGGTLFLDEIGEMPLALQAKLLRFLETGEIQRVGDNDVFRVDVRIVAATHQPLEAHTEARLFRLDLYHRLAVFPIDVPTLRSRPGDIPMLVDHFLHRLGTTSPRKSVDAAALAELCRAPWKGNVRELSHVLQRAVILAGDAPCIGTAHLRMHGASL